MWSLGRRFAAKKVLSCECRYQKAAAGQCHQLCDLVGLKDVGHGLLVLIGTPVVEWPLVIDGSSLRQQVDGINFGTRLLVSGLKLGNVVTGPESSFHVRERLGVLKHAKRQSCPRIGL